MCDGLGIESSREVSDREIPTLNMNKKDNLQHVSLCKAGLRPLGHNQNEYVHHHYASLIALITKPPKQSHDHIP
jgi:hypothetical protein